MIFIILIFSTAFGATLKIDRSYLTSPVERILLQDLYPPKIARLKKFTKRPIPYGTPNAVTASLIDQIDSCPVIEMLHYLGEFIRSDGRRFPLNLPDNFHSWYLFTSRFIDVRVFRLLVRIATGQRRDGELEIKSACDIINFLQKNYPHVDFNYLTPQYILDWYSLIGLTPVLKGQTKDGRLDESFNSSNPQLLALDRGLWVEKILKVRRDRIQRSGYESTVLEILS